MTDEQLMTRAEYEPRHDALLKDIDLLRQSIEELRKTVEKQSENIATVQAGLTTAKWIMPLLTAIIGAESTGIMFSVLHI